MGRAFDHSTSFIDAMMLNNIVINGNCEVSQENGTTLITLATGAAAKYIVDMFQASFTNSVGVLKAQQASISLPGYVNGLMLQSTTAFGALAAGDYATVHHLIEGYRIQKLGFGASTAFPITISFWVWATATGTFSVALRNAAGNRSYVQNVTISAGSSWQYCSLTFPGDITGTWGTGGSLAAYITFCFAAGSTYQTTGGAWQAGNFFATSSNTNFFGTLNNQVFITGVTAFGGSEGPSQARAPYCMRTFAEELYLCQRYYEVGTEPQMWLGGAMTATGGYGGVPFTVTKRIAPTMSSTGWQYWQAGGAAAVTPAWASSIYQGTWTTSGLTNWNGWVTGGTWKADARL